LNATSPPTGCTDRRLKESLQRSDECLRRRDSRR
jgi:hypothetical protein